MTLTVSVSLVSSLAACGETARDRFFNSDGIRIRYQLSGRGPAVVLIHGFGESLESWQRTGAVQALSQHFQVIAIDVRGHGRSAKPHEPKSYGAELAGDVARLLRHLGVQKAHVVGYSLGAVVALDFAVLYQEQVLSVVLGGAGWNPPESLAEFRQQAELFEQGKIAVRDGDDARALAAMLRGLGVLTEEQVRGIRVPVSVVIGANDRFLPNVKRLSQVLPHVQVTVIPDVDHATAPSDRRLVDAVVASLLKP